MMSEIRRRRRKEERNLKKVKPNPEKERKDRRIKIYGILALVLFFILALIAIFFKAIWEFRAKYGA
ncbi:hypothetical protein [Flagellimonas profundi]|jgi:cell division septal protein FtsQ|uniref:Uncharacterized protein n=1 Tax=Flagellimonas profundi TaxID=2915620 RepID=A0ABS3FCP0_9FLAO|nr:MULTISPECIES: hypothetical protein [Allomuricauda]MAU15819.1 hypothetical protein [Allomuricauda sp.]MBO0340702.1 hypothetical protein [Allomuricauda profundi]MBV35817.1 hypothetical protein [Rickettsiales bacterium]|tara:strand:+ start:1906 stop:2103 length:198 start_codon:yes stop_codon:yes gene_type:complete